MNNYSSKLSIIYDLLVLEDDVNEFLDRYFKSIQELLKLNSLVYYVEQAGVFNKAKSYGIDQPFADIMKTEELLQLFSDSNIIKLGEFSPLRAFYKEHITYAILIRSHHPEYGLVLIGKSVEDKDESIDPVSISLFFNDLGEIVSDYDNIRSSVINRCMKIASPVTRSLTHDVRNPIQMITILTEMLKAKELPLEKRLNLYNKLNDGLNQIDKIVTEISDLFKDNYDLNIDEVPSSIFFNDIKNQIQSQLQRLKIHFEMSVNFNMSFEVDSEKMKDVILRMIKYSRDLVQFDGLISLSADAQRDSIIITIIDTSEGIDQKVLKNQKNPFFNYGTRLGTGLNFAIMHKVIEAHRGTLSITNEKEGGAKFVITLPKKITK